MDMKTRKRLTMIGAFQLQEGDDSELEHEEERRQEGTDESV